MLPEVGKSSFQYSRVLIERNRITNSNSKPIDVRRHFIRDLVARKGIPITHVASEYQHADFLTKAISRESFELHRDCMMNL